ncbi:MAG: hypothetical protein AB1445_00680 [Bacillota bacterium]
MSKPRPKPSLKGKTCKDCRHFVALIYFCEKHSQKRPDMEVCEHFRFKPFTLFPFGGGGY